MGKRLSFAVAAAALSVGLIAPRPAVADPILVTGGGVSAYWDGSLDGLALTGNGLSIVGDDFANGPAGFSYGSLANLDGGFFFYDEPPRSYPATVNGTAYTAFLVGSGAFTTQPFLASSTAPAGAIVSFSTPFTFTGSVQGYPAADKTGPTLFDVQLVGTGTATGTFEATGDPPGVFLNKCCGVAYSFSSPSPSPTPEPASLFLLGTGGLVLVACSLRRRRS